MRIVILSRLTLAFSFAIYKDLGKFSIQAISALAPSSSI